MLSVRESLLKELGTVVDDLVIEQVIRTGTADIGEKYLTVIRKAAGDYTKEIFHKLREREYNPELMRLYVVGGGGCMIQNFEEYDKSRVTIVRDICATAKGYEAMTVRKIQRNGGMLVPFVKESVGEINLPDRTLTMEKTDGEITEDNLDWEKEADMDAALDFADSF